MPAHEFYGAAQEWFRAKSRHGWATCPMTQAGFVRIVSNPAFSRDAVSPAEAMALLARSTEGPHHSFWTDALPYEEAISPLGVALRGHRQVTDAYLLGLAVHKGGRLATFDKGVAALTAPPPTHARNIEVVEF